ncbi:MAG: hypothetical protein SynsKO_23860 [Synoicihabitans sp.]
MIETNVREEDGAEVGTVGDGKRALEESRTAAEKSIRSHEVEIAVDEGDVAVAGGKEVAEAA